MPRGKKTKKIAKKTVKGVSVIGLGKLGLPIALCFADKGFHTIGIDVNPKTLESLAKTKAPFYEPGVQELLKKTKKNFESSNDINRAVAETDITFIIVPTPSKSDDEFSNKFVEEVINKLALSLKTAEKKYHLFVISSTVMPGSTDKIFIPLFESVSGKSAGKDFGVCYNPEFIAIGSVISNFLNPDVLLIGEQDKKAGKVLSDFYEKVLDNKPYVAKMSITSAELMKISLNAFITMKISFANQLSQICHKTPGADLDAITTTLGKDSRIGGKYLKGGTSYGGPCFPRDSRAFSAFAKKQGEQAHLAIATDDINNRHDKVLLDAVLANLGDKKRVLVIGAAYKENTEVIEESASVRLMSNLLNHGVEVHVHDTLAEENIKKHFGDKVKIVNFLEKSSLDEYSVCVLALPSKKHKTALEKLFYGTLMTLIDCWRVIDHSRLKGKVNHIPIGNARN